MYGDVEILAGDVLFANNNLLCHVSTIDWSDILSRGARVEFHNDTRDKHISSTCKYSLLLTQISS